MQESFALLRGRHPTTQAPPKPLVTIGGDPIVNPISYCPGDPTRKGDDSPNSPQMREKSKDCVRLFQNPAVFQKQGGMELTLWRKPELCSGKFALKRG
jgi:hypothetical protein